MPATISNKVDQASLAPMDEAEFRRWVAMIERRMGAVLPAERKTFLVTRLRMRMRETGHTSFQSYYDSLGNGVKGQIEWVTLVDRLTVQQTSFFRHAPSFDLIEREWLPQFIAQRLTHDPLNVWSVGCSTGEEAYSLAMCVDAALEGEGSARGFGISATDISREALNIARNGKYPSSRFGELPERFQKRYCKLVGDEFEIGEELKRRLGFAMFNLIDMQSAPQKRVDLAFCQNVLIYFAREHRRELMHAVADRLTPGGLMILGPGEILSFSHPALERVGGPKTLAFRRKA